MGNRTANLQIRSPTSDLTTPPQRTPHYITLVHTAHLDALLHPNTRQLFPIWFPLPPLSSNRAGCRELPGEQVAPPIYSLSHFSSTSRCEYKWRVPFANFTPDHSMSAGGAPYLFLSVFFLHIKSGFLIAVPGNVRTVNYIESHTTWFFSPFILSFWMVSR